MGPAVREGLVGVHDAGTHTHSSTVHSVFLTATWVKRDRLGQLYYVVS